MNKSILPQATYDKIKDQIIAKQKKLGVIPEDAELTGRHDVIPGWDDMPAELKPVLDGGTLFVANANDTLLAIEPATGKLLWSSWAIPEPNPRVW